MNLGEGTRRLALLVGGIGFIGGSLGSYVELKRALQQKAVHERFERLSASDDVTKERKCRLRGGAGGCSLDPNADMAAIAEPEDGLADIAEPRSPEEIKSLREDWKKLSRADQEKFVKSLTPKQLSKFARDAGWVPTSKADPYADIAIPPTSELGRNEIKTINWAEGQDLAVESITTEDGNTLRAIPLPSRWIFLWIVVLPMAGFIVPWGLIRSVSWVAAGFVADQKSS